MPTNVDKNTLEDMIIFDEGFRDTIYRDTEGFLTIGIGFCLDRIRMPENVARFWLEEILADTLEHLESTDDIFPIFEKLDTYRKMAIINMCYQMGVRGVHGFRNMWAALKKEDYDEAYREGKESSWYRQTPERAERVLQVLKTNDLNSVYWGKS